MNERRPTQAVSTPPAVLPASNPRAQYLAHADAIQAAIGRVLEGGRYILGPEVDAFEREFAAWMGVKHAIGVANGTDALAVSLRACGVGPGDEVVSVSLTAVATIAAIEQVGATPVLVDVDPVTLTMDPAGLRRAVTKRTRAVIPVHLHGHPADIAAIGAIAADHKLHLIEDCAQAHGARIGTRRVGSIGIAGCFSFYPTKNLGALGDGGMLVTNDDGVADRARMLRQYGWRDAQVSAIPGSNTRLDELQAAVLRVKLPHLDADNAARRRIAARYDQALGPLGLEPPAKRGDIEHVYHQYVVRTDHRDALLEHLKTHGIAAGIHYPRGVHEQPAYRGRLAQPGDLPTTERMTKRILSMPMYPELSAGEQDRVIAAVTEFGRARSNAPGGDGQ